MSLPQVAVNLPANEANIADVKHKLLEHIYAVTDEKTLDSVRVSLLGKSGLIPSVLKNVSQVPLEGRKEQGALLNQFKDEITEAIEIKKRQLSAAGLEKRLAEERVDVTLSPRPQNEGRVHPISQTIEEVITIFASMGFSVAKGPDIESDYYNFTALNIPPNHPARQMQDTFYLPQTGEHPTVLRTHTSPVQIHTMMKQKPPIRVIIPGRTFRVDHDMTHTPMFHQVEGLVIDEATNMSHLKGCLLDFLRAFFGIPDLPLRFRPSYFPFTEPSAEVDIGCSRKSGELKLGNFGDWLEWGGCGMVHPNVLRNCDLDPEKYQGFAFGCGIDRLAMLKYGIPDLRTFFDADIRWLKHYGFAALDIPNPALRG